MTEEEKREAEDLLRKLDGEPMTLSAGDMGPGLQLRDPSNVVGDRELAASLRDAEADTPTLRKSFRNRRMAEEADNKAEYTPDRPKFKDIPSDKEDAPEKKKPGRGDPGYYKTEEIEKLLADLDEAQGKDKTKKKGDRRRYWGLMAGEAASAGFQNRKMQDVGTPPDAYNETAAVEKRANMSDKLQTGEMKRQNPAEERELKDILARLKTQAEADRLETSLNHKTEENDKKLTATHDNETMKEGGRNARTDKLIRAGLAGKILQMYSAAGTSGARTDAEYANKQATYQIPEWDQMKPNSQGDHSEGAKLAGAEKAFNEVGRRLADGLRKNGPAFLRSTEWDEVAGDYMALNQVLNHLNANGVMNFKDKDNNDVQIGNAQSLVQYVQQNGPEVLDHALSTMRVSTDAKMSQLGYKRHSGDWNPKTPGQYVPQGGGSSGRGPVVNPNAAGGLADWSIKGGQMPGVGPQSPNMPSVPGQQAPRRKILKRVAGVPTIVEE